jgi:hypothetical protein
MLDQQMLGVYHSTMDRFCWGCDMSIEIGMFHGRMKALMTYDSNSPNGGTSLTSAGPLPPSEAHSADKPTPQEQRCENPHYEINQPSAMLKNMHP